MYQARALVLPSMLPVQFRRIHEFSMGMCISTSQGWSSFRLVIFISPASRLCLSFRLVCLDLASFALDLFDFGLLLAIRPVSFRFILRVRRLGLSFRPVSLDRVFGSSTVLYLRDLWLFMVVGKLNNLGRMVIPVWWLDFPDLLLWNCRRLFLASWCLGNIWWPFREALSLCNIRRLFLASVWLYAFSFILLLIWLLLWTLW